MSDIKCNYCCVGDEYSDLKIEDVAYNKDNAHWYEFRIFYDIDLETNILYMESDITNISIKINYCPICGRKL